MFLLKIVFKAIKLAFRLAKIALKIVYNVLKFLRIRLLALYLIVCALLQASFGIFNEGIFVAYFWVGVLLFLGLTVFSWISHWREKHKRKKLSESAYAAQERSRGWEEEKPPYKPVRPTYPMYFEVEGRPDYMFAEYEDRYELFVREASGWSYVKTDYKQ